MPTFAPKLQIPAIRIQPPATAKPAPAPATTGEALTLDALMARQKDAAQRQQGVMEQPVTNIPQGLSQMAWTLVDALQQRRAEKGIQEGEADVARAFGQMDPVTGELPPEALQLLMQRDPETGMEMYKTAMLLRAQKQKAEADAAAANAPKLSDASSMVGHVLQDPSYKNMQQAAPIWASMVDANSRDTPQADLNMVIALAKLFDPTSVVRTQEGEQVVQTGGLPSQIFSQWKFLTGEPGARLKPDIRQGMLEEGWSRVSGYEQAYNQTRKQWTDYATRHGMDPADIPTFQPFTPYKRPEADPDNPNPDETPPAPEITTPDAPIPEIDPQDMDAYNALPDGAKYKVPGDDTVYTKGQK